MRKLVSIVLAGYLAVLLLGERFPAFAQDPKAAAAPPSLQAIEVAEPGGQILSFRYLSGSTAVEMRGTRLEPQASTRMKIGSRPGFTEIDINRGEIRGLQPARRFGKDFLTYVLWAVSVDGEASNLGEISFDATGPVSINVTTPLQTFWLMVTVEPDFAVNDPSPVVVMYSVNQDAVPTEFKALPVSGKLLYYTYYGRYDTSPAAVDTFTPNELLQGRKAVELASQAGILATPTPAAEELLPDELRTRQTLQQARDYLEQAEAAFRSGGKAREAVQFARTAVAVAENARALALGAVGGIVVRQLERSLERLRAEASRLTSALAEREKQLGALAETERLLAAQRDRTGSLEAELDRERQANRDASGRAAAAEARIQELSERLAALQQQFQQAQVENGRLRDDHEKICGELRRQLASLGQLTQQGGNLALTLASDILFDFNSYELRPSARENLAKLVVLRMLLFPHAQVKYVGYTDLVGDADYNQWLSEQRALAVYRYFLEDTLARAPVSAEGDAAGGRLSVVTQLKEMSYQGSRRGVASRQQLLAQLGDMVVGWGESDPVENVPTASERNRRVVLLIPPAQVGQVTSLCQASSSQ